jgi:hypothetical protein
LEAFHISQFILEAENKEESILRALSSPSPWITRWSSSNESATQFQWKSGGGYPSSFETTSNWRW